jgi:hypothetical protein
MNRRLFWLLFVLRWVFAFALELAFLTGTCRLGVVRDNHIVYIVNRTDSDVEDATWLIENDGSKKPEGTRNQGRKR